MKSKTKAVTAGEKRRRKFKQEFPPGWNETEIRQVIAHYDSLTQEELAREIEQAAEVSGQTLVAVPNELLSQVFELIARQRGRQ